MEYIIGILILASFFGLAVYAARGGNLMMGMLIMAILWTILPMTGNLLASNPEFIAANGDSIRITWIQAFQMLLQMFRTMLSDNTELSEEKINDLVDTFMNTLPALLKSQLQAA